MAFHEERDKQSGERCLVIDGWEKGLADSPYTGITSMKNLNVSWMSGAAYVNYKRQPVTLSGGTMGIPKFYTQSPGTSPTYYIVDDKGQIWQSAAGGSTWTLLTGNHTAGSGLGFGIAYFKDYLFVFGNNYIDVCGNGTGVGGITSGNWVSIAGSGYYFKNISARTITPVTAGDNHITLGSSWDFASGRYQVVVGSGAQTVVGTFTNGSTNVPITPNIISTNASTTADINLFTLTSPVNHMALVAINDALYFCNGNTIGAISLPDTAPGTTVFNVTNFSSQQILVDALTLRTTDRAVWLTELSQNLVIAVKDYIYYWDKTSTTKNGVPFQTFTAAPINEQPSRMLNILNTVYIFAGQKGNIYMTNGYAVSLFKKIPDSFLGVIDPYWVIGGMMFHRNKLWFGAVGASNSGTTKIQGIFSVALIGGSSSFAYETAGAINFESQNSYGISPTVAADGTGILIDLTSFYGSGLGSGIASSDSYQSAYYNNSVGGIDFNDTTLWQNFEPAIETDLIPIGNFLTSSTLAQIEFKLDRPMASGDQIRLSYRTSFTDSYTQMGTTTAAVLSDIYDTGINTAQWVQFKVEFKCASSGSSFIVLREIRLHFGN